MLEPTYRQALTQAWHLVWRNKILWVFGLLSVLVGPFGINNFIGQLSVFLSRPPLVLNYPRLFLVLVEGKGAPWMVWMLVLALALGILVAFVAVASQGALIAVAADGYKKKKTLNFEKAWHKGAKHFWRLFFLNVLRKVALGAILMAVALALVRLPETTVGFVAAIGILSLGLLLALTTVSVGIYSAGYVVEDQKGLGSSLRKGWALFAHHILVSAELSIILVLFDISAIAGVVIISTLALVPLFILSIVAGFSGFTSLIAVGAVISSFAFVILIALVGAVYNAFITSAWIYLFMKMHHTGVASRILHWLTRR